MINTKEGTHFSLKNRSIFQWIMFVVGCICLLGFLMPFFRANSANIFDRIGGLVISLLLIWSATTPQKKDIPKDVYDDVLDADLDED